MRELVQDRFGADVLGRLEHEASQRRVDKGHDQERNLFDAIASDSAAGHLISGACEGEVPLPRLLAMRLAKREGYVRGDRSQQILAGSHCREECPEPDRDGLEDRNALEIGDRSGGVVGKALCSPAHDLEDEGVLVVEVLVQGSDADSGPFGDVIGGERAVAALDQKPSSGLDDRVESHAGARLLWDLLGAEIGPHWGVEHARIHEQNRDPSKTELLLRLYLRPWKRQQKFLAVGAGSDSPVPRAISVACGLFSACTSARPTPT